MRVSIAFIAVMAGSSLVACGGDDHEIAEEGEAASAVSQHGEVSLLMARSITASRSGVSRQEATFAVLVQDLSTSKEVAVRLQDGNSTWIEVPARFVRDADDGRELWEASYAESTALGGKPHDLRFAVRCSAGGRSYWDNNHDADYLLGQDDGTRLFSTLLFHGSHRPSAQIAGDAYHGTITVQSLAPEKKVNVVYTVDGWRTTRVAGSDYTPDFWRGSFSGAKNPNAHGVEERSFLLDVAGGDVVEYAISYEVSGSTYWDNNFGHNYVTALHR
jgi:Carbohydrate/starch-binding module (family 21)